MHSGFDWVLDGNTSVLAGRCVNKFFYQGSSARCQWLSGDYLPLVTAIKGRLTSPCPRVWEMFVCANRVDEQMEHPRPAKRDLTRSGAPRDRQTRFSRNLASDTADFGHNLGDICPLFAESGTSSALSRDAGVLAISQPRSPHPHLGFWNSRHFGLLAFRAHLIKSVYFVSLAGKSCTKLTFISGWQETCLEYHFLPMFAFAVEAGVFHVTYTESWLTSVPWGPPTDSPLLTFS